MDEAVGRRARGGRLAPLDLEVRRSVRISSTSTALVHARASLSRAPKLVRGPLRRALLVASREGRTRARPRGTAIASGGRARASKTPDFVGAPTQERCSTRRCGSTDPFPRKRVLPNGRAGFDSRRQGAVRVRRRADVGRGEERRGAWRRIEVAWPVRIAGEGSLIGHLSDAERVRDLMARASIYALPARYEPFGLSILEAALAELRPRARRHPFPAGELGRTGGFRRAWRRSRRAAEGPSRALIEDRVR